MVNLIEHLDDYKQPVRESDDQVLDIRIYCNHPDCKKYIKGKEGYNGAFMSENGLPADLRNNIWLCAEHLIQSQIEKKKDPLKGRPSHGMDDLASTNRKNNRKHIKLIEQAYGTSKQ